MGQVRWGERGAIGMIDAFPLGTPLRSGAGIIADARRVGTPRLGCGFGLLIALRAYFLGSSSRVSNQGMRSSKKAWSWGSKDSGASKALR